MSGTADPPGSLHWQVSTVNKPSHPFDMPVQPPLTCPDPSTPFTILAHSPSPLTCPASAQCLAPLTRARRLAEPWSRPARAPSAGASRGPAAAETAQGWGPGRGHNRRGSWGISDKADAMQAWVRGATAGTKEPSREHSDMLSHPQATVTQPRPITAAPRPPGTTHLHQPPVLGAVQHARQGEAAGIRVGAHFAALLQPAP